MASSRPRTSGQGTAGYWTNWPIVLGLVVALGGALWSSSHPLDPSEEVGAWGIFALSVALLLYGMLRNQPGLVFVAELTLTARRGRFPFFRALYCAFLLLVLLGVYIAWFGLGQTEAAASIMEERSIPATARARFAAAFFQTFLVVQFGVVYVLTCSSCAGILLEENERGTLDLLLATGLTTGEIITGKLVSRVVNLVVLQLAGLPVLAILQLVGGISPAQLTAGFVSALLVTLSMGALSAHVSLNSPTVAKAVFDSLTAVGVVHGCVGYVMINAMMAQWWSASPVSLWGLFVNAGLTALLLADISGRRLYLGEPAVPRDTVKGHHHRDLLTRRPPVPDDTPLLWKECHVDLGPIGQTFGPNHEQERLAGFVIVGGLLLFFGVSTSLASPGNAGVRRLIAACVPMFAILACAEAAFRASARFSRERERRTLEVLLTTDVTNEEILRAKWWASLGDVRAPVGGLGLALVGASIVAPVPFVSLPLGVLAVVVQGSLAITVGLTCSLACRTSTRAAVATGVALVALGLGHWILFLFASALLYLLGLREWVRPLQTFHAHGLTPTTALTDLASLGGPEFPGGGAFASALIGTLLYGTLAAGLWWRLGRRFATVSGRAS